MVKCPLFKLCNSPSKQAKGWACTKDEKQRKLMCAVYVAFYRGVRMQRVLDLDKMKKILPRKH